MRIVGVVLALALVACNTSSAETDPAEEGSPKTVLDMVKSGDTKVCADKEIYNGALAMAVRKIPYVISKDTFQAYLKRNGGFNVSAVTAEGVDRELAEVKCSANVNLAGTEYRFDYSVKPALDAPDDYVVTFKLDPQSSETFVISLVQEMGAGLSDTQGRSGSFDMKPTDPEGLNEAIATLPTAPEVTNGANAEGDAPATSTAADEEPATDPFAESNGGE